MTWGEFKRRLDALGVRDEEEIWYIDIHPFRFFQCEYGKRGGDGSVLGWAIADNDFGGRDKVERIEDPARGADSHGEG